MSLFPDSGCFVTLIAADVTNIDTLPITNDLHIITGSELDDTVCISAMKKASEGFRPGEIDIILCLASRSYV
jgi:hypothetical protein